MALVSCSFMAVSLCWAIQEHRCQAFAGDLSQTPAPAPARLVRLNSPAQESQNPPQIPRSCGHTPWYLGTMLEAICVGCGMSSGTRFMKVRVPLAQQALWAGCAKSSGRDLSAWVRAVLDLEMERPRLSVIEAPEAKDPQTLQPPPVILPLPPKEKLCFQCARNVRVSREPVEGCVGCAALRGEES